MSDRVLDSCRGRTFVALDANRMCVAHVRVRKSDLRDFVDDVSTAVVI